MASSSHYSQALIIRSTPGAILQPYRRTAGPSSIIGQGYTWAGHKIIHSVGKVAHKMGKGPGFPAQDIEQAFGVGTDRKLKRLCDLYDLEQNRPRQLSPGCPDWDWDIDKLEHYCRSLSGYASPVKTPKTQLEAFKDIVRVVTCYPGLRRVFCRDSSPMVIEPEVLWRREDEEIMDNEWKLFRQLAASCIAEKDLDVTKIVEEVRPDDLGGFFDHSEGIVERLVMIATDTINTKNVPRIIAIRYLGGILQLPPFWLEERNKLTPAEKLLAGAAGLVKNLGLDLSHPCTRRELLCQDTEGIDFLVDAVLTGMDDWAGQLKHSPGHLSDLPKWLKLSVDLMSNIKEQNVTRVLPRTKLAVVRVGNLRKYLTESSCIGNVSSWTEASQLDNIPTEPPPLVTLADSTSVSQTPLDDENDEFPSPASQLASLTENPHSRGIRILLVGKTGCGKSSLINKVFGVDQAEVSHDRPGTTDIQIGFRHSSNNRFILHEAEGFEPGESEKLNKAKCFIEERTRSEMPETDKLHVIWICISMPRANERVIETEVQEVFNMAQERKIPAIIIFTKYDQLVTTAMSDFDAVDHLDKEGMFQYGEHKAIEAFENLCIGSWREAVGKVPLMVSTRDRYKNTIKVVIEATDREIQQQTGISHTEPHSLNFTAAQRVNTDMKIDASIDIGRLKYWRRLLSNTDFSGKKLRQCLDAIHRDIVSVWNIENLNLLISDTFKAKLIVLVDDLVSNPNTPRYIYIFTSGNVACMMGYVVDLTIIMHRLSFAVEVSEETVETVLLDYARSSQIFQVHNDIRKFINDNFPFRLRDNDYTLNEIIRLIKKHRVQVPLRQ
ncbi:hypothetical protein BU17DRAFT_83721 [Hysterangium stoloniferum]|nr:hypothetical protein BU17DRAFT_83721 [Hysterangium stoloniferum]